MKVLQVFGQAELGGATTHIALHSAELERQGIWCAAVVDPNGSVNEQFKRFGLRTFEFDGLRRGMSPTEDLRFGRFLRALVREHKIDIVHLHSFKAGLIGRLALRNSATTSLIYTPHCAVYLTEMGRLARMLSYAIERALSINTHTVVAVSPWELQRLRLPHTSLANNPVEFEDRFLPGGLSSATAEEGPVDLLFVGRLARQKRQDLAIQALALIPEDERPTLRLVGEGPTYRELRQLTEELKLHRWVVFHGHVSQPWELANERTIALLLADWESQPIAVLEAMANGMPFIVSAVGDMTRLAGQCELGLVVDDDPRTVASTIQKLQELTHDPYIRRSGGRSSREYIGTNHDVGGTTRQLAKLYAATPAASRRPTVDLAV